MMTASIHPLARPAVHSQEKGNAANTTHQIYSAPSRNPLKLKVKRPDLHPKSGTALGAVGCGGRRAPRCDPASFQAPTKLQGTRAWMSASQQQRSV